MSAVITRFILSAFPLLMLALVLTAASPARGDVTIRDPNGILSDLRNFVGSPSWDRGIRCGERQTFYRSAIFCDSKCSSRICMSTCTPADSTNNSFELAIEDCQAHQISIYGTNNFEGTLSRAEYEATGTWILPLLRAANSFLRPTDHIEVFSGGQRLIRIIENGQMRQEFGYSLSLNFRAQTGGMEQIYEIGFLPRGSLLSSLVYFEELGGMEYFLRAKGVVSGF